MEKKCFLFCLLTISLSFKNYGQAIGLDSLLNKKYSTKSLIDDLSFINKNIDPKQYGNSAFYFFSKKEWDAKYDVEIQYLKNFDSLSLGQFYLRLLPLLNLLHDDHLELSYPRISEPINSDNRNLRDNNIILPIRIVLSNDSAFVACSDILPVKTAILSINNIPIKIIIDSLSNFISYPYQRYYRKNRFISFDFVSQFIIFYQLFHMRDSVELKYISEFSDKPESKYFKLNNISSGVISTYCYSKQMENLSSKFEDKVAIINLNTFNQNINSDSLIAEYNKLFKKIKNNSAEKLIIDLRYNSGGSDVSWILLLPYLTNSMLKFNCNREFLDVAFVLKNLHVNTSEINADVQFKGKVFLLIGYRTFSSAVRFADFIKYNHLADSIFGIETLGQASHYGQSKSYHLPNSQLHFIVSDKLFLSIDCKGDVSGVTPDVYLKSNSGREYLENILSAKDISKVIDLIK
jgi:hypothetical protein